MTITTSYENFYPRPPRGGRPSGPTSQTSPDSISIHALREEGDIGSLPPGSRFTYFYPRPPRGGRPRHYTSAKLQNVISIHALREEGDRQRPRARRALRKISIHALREEGDSSGAQHRQTHRNFYPRPPRGGRRITAEKRRGNTNFYPRPPRGGRPCDMSVGEQAIKFLSTPSARRATAQQRAAAIAVADFYPRPPRGGRRRPSRRTTASGNFYPRPPRGGRP